MTAIIAIDDGSGQIAAHDIIYGSINYATGALTLSPGKSVEKPTFINGEWMYPGTVHRFTPKEIYATYTATSATPVNKTQLVAIPPVIFAFGNELTVDTLVPRSLRFLWGGYEYRDTAGSGSIYYQQSPWNSNLTGTFAGTVNYLNRRVTLTTYPSNSSGPVTVLSCLTKYGEWPTDYAYGRTPGAPLVSGSFYVQATTNDGRSISATSDTNGVIDATEIQGVVNQEMGVFELSFGKMVTAAGNEGEFWYDPAKVVGAEVWQPTYVITDSIRMNAVVLNSVPLSAQELGLDPVRVPSTGKVSIFKPGYRLLIHNTQFVVVPNPAVAGSIINCGRTGLARVWLEDALGRRVPDDRIYPGQFVMFSSLTPEQKATYEWWQIRDDGTVWQASSTDLDAGTVQLSTPLDLTGYDQPLKLYHTIEDSALCTTVDLSGYLTLNKALTHNYPANTSFVSSQLYIGDIWARYTNLFSQATWTGEWSEVKIGSDTAGQYNDGLWPLLVTNHGVIDERWRLTFTSNSQFNVYGERSGLVISGDISTDCSPINPATNSPYFTIKADGWGLGWVTGNTLRFNTLWPGAFWLARCVTQGQATGTSDSIGITFRGDSEPA